MASTDVGVSTCSDGSSTGCVGPSTGTDVSASLLLRQVVIVLRQAVGSMTLLVSCHFPCSDDTASTVVPRLVSCLLLVG